MRPPRNNFKRLAFFLVITLTLSLFILGLNIKSAESADDQRPGLQNEGNNLTAAIAHLRWLECKILPTQCSSYPGPSSFATTCRTADVCWNSPSIIGSTSNLHSQFVYWGGVPAYDNGGDVRYRCRRQKDKIYCFAFRCEEAEPAGCKQMWRVQLNFQVSIDIMHYPKIITLTTLPLKCIDVGATDYHGFKDHPVCDDVNQAIIGQCSSSYQCN
ncbi:MAG: hypothetical protein P9M07_07425 [Candidatus Aceula meridiana]|nr:hypothetical protein [Candidatus Aceula meridiana]